VINNSKKTIDANRSIVSQAHGTADLYDFLDRNPAIEVHPARYVNDPQLMAKIDNLIAMVGALKIDVTGQVATDSIAHKFYGGVWSDDESLRGARFSKGGKPIVVLASKSLSGRSNIVFQLPPGTGVSITRSDAYLYGKSIRERCLALIHIAHPDFRQELLEECKDHMYLSKSQPGFSFTNVYPKHLESYHTTKQQNEVFVRPIKAMDEDYLRKFFHKLSDHSVYLRYFRKLKSMPQRILQRTSDVDYSSDLTLVVFYPARVTDQEQKEMVAIGQWISSSNNSERNLKGNMAPPPPEIAFQVRDDWQGNGLGKFLFRRLVEIAQTAGLTRFKADVLDSNQAMKAVFQRSGIPFKKRSDFGVITYSFDLTEVNQGQ